MFIMPLKERSLSSFMYGSFITSCNLENSKTLVCMVNKSISAPNLISNSNSDLSVKKKYFGCICCKLPIISLAVDLNKRKVCLVLSKTKSSKSVFFFIASPSSLYSISIELNVKKPYKYRAYLFFWDTQNYSSGCIASIGQTSAQVPHSTHFEGSIL